MSSSFMWITPDWPAPPEVRAISTTRHHGVATGVYASLNLALHVGDEASTVLANRQLLTEQAQLPATPAWLEQVHGTTVLDLANWTGDVIAADAALAQQANQVCVVMTADCLPILLCWQGGHCQDGQAAKQQVAAIHAGWRGLCNGIIEQTLAHFSEPTQLMAWLGPAIGPTAFEVGAEVRAAFLAKDPAAELAFVAQPSGKYLADLYQLARLRLQAAGVSAIYGGNYCTFTQQERFFSYRRDGQTGRQASLIWIAEANGR